MEIAGDNFTVAFEPSEATVRCEGSLRLFGSEGYAQIVDLFNAAADQGAETLTLDLTKLRFLNSSGINAISKFVIRVRNADASRLVVRSSKRCPWQGKSLKNLKRLMPDLIVEIQ